MLVVARLVTKRPLLTLVVVALASLVPVGLLVDLDQSPPQSRLQIDPSLDRVLSDRGETRRYYDETGRRFGSQSAFLVAVASDDLFSRIAFDSLKRLSDRLAALDGVERVVSLFTALDIHSEDDDFVIEPFVSEVPKTLEEFSDLKARALANPVYAGNLISRDARTTSLLVYPEEMTERELLQSGLDLRILEAGAEEEDVLRVWITGSPHIKAAMSRLLKSDLARIIPLGLLVNAIIAFLAFRSLRGVLVPLATILLAILWTVGVMASLGYSLNLVTMVVPALIQTVGFTYTIHVVSEYYDELRRGRSHPGSVGKQAAKGALEHLLEPLTLTALTTGAGLLSLTLSPFPAVREFGILSVCGIVFSVLLAATLAPAALAVWPQRPGGTRSGRDFFDQLADRLARFDVRHRRSILAAAFLLLAFFGVAMTRMQINTSFVTNFAADNPVRRDYDAISKALDGASSLAVVIEADSRDAFKDPANLRQLVAIEEWLDSQPEVGSTTSLADYVRVIHRGFRGGAAEHLSIPDSKRLVSQLLFFGANDELSSVVDDSYRSTRMLVRHQTRDSTAISRLVERTEDRLAELPEPLTGRVTGESALVAKAVDEISAAQLLSIAAALFIIYLALALLFRSATIGALAMIPNALTVAFYFGLLGLSGVTLNATTGLVACLALGIAVDDTIHYLLRFRRQARRESDIERLAGRALRSVGRPVTVTSIALCLGFLVLTTASLRNQVEFGIMTSCTLAFAWFVDMLLTPAVAVWARQRGRWGSPEENP